MLEKFKSIRPFLGAKNFDISRNFYWDLGFKEKVLFLNMSLFEMGNLSFYLQDAYVKDWIDNTMIFLEVEDVATYYEKIKGLNLTSKYKEVKLVPIKDHPWGRECYLHDPSGILWHIGTFKK